MTFEVYILLCEDGSFYTGYSKDLAKRVELLDTPRYINQKK
jgi:predicted GIY-YIG superfamily endonuclease